MKLRILFAEDDPNLREEWTNTLSHKFEVDQAQGMREALYRFCIQAPHAAVLSLNVPAPEGIRLLALMNQFQPTCPIILFSAEPEIYQQAMRPGLDTLLKKPVAYEELFRVLQGLAAQLKLDGLDASTAEPITPTFVISPRGGGRHYHKKTAVLART